MSKNSSARTLEQANHHYIAKEYEKAADLFADYFKNEPRPSERTYVRYARCLDHIDTKKSVSLLQKGVKQHPASIPIRLQLHLHLDRLSLHSEAKVVAESLIKLDSERPLHYFKLGRSLFWLKDKEAAKDAFEAGLEVAHATNISSLFKEIQDSINPDATEARSEYTFVNGLNNLGAIFHTVDGKDYFTKILYQSRMTNDELYFYTNITLRSESLRKVTPRYISHIHKDDITYLTMERLSSLKPNDSHFEQVVKLSRQVSSDENKTLAKTLPPPNSTPKLGMRATTTRSFFMQIHKKHINERLLSSLPKMISTQEKDYSELQEIISRLRHYILDNSLYSLLDPEVSYSFIHTDLNRSNLVIGKEGGFDFRIIDWALYGRGFRLYDIATFYTLLRPDRTVESLVNNELSEHSVIEKIFFLYATVSMSLLLLSRPDRDRVVSIAREAINLIPPLIDTLTIQDFKESLARVAKDNGNLDAQLENCAKEVATLANKNLELEQIKSSVS